MTPLSRRHLLTAAVVTLSGCSESSEPSTTDTQTQTPTASPTATNTPTETPEPQHQFADTVAQVEIVDESDREGVDVEQIATEALDYWEEKSVIHLDYEFEYELVTSGSNLELRFVEEIVRECGNVDHEDVVGCADLYEAGDSFETAEAEVLVGQQPRIPILRTVKHELGHVLGLQHWDEPQRVMSNDPADYLAKYETRQTLLDQYDASIVEYNEAMNIESEATGAWNEEDYTTARNQYREAETEMQDAIDELSAGLDTVEELEFVVDESIRYDDAVAALESAHTAATEMQEYMRLMAEAADAAASDLNQSARNRYDSASNHLEAAQEATYVTNLEFAAKIGMQQFYEQENA